MQNVYKKLINLGLKVLAILAFGLLLLPGMAAADTAGDVTPYGTTTYPTPAPNNYTFPNNYYSPAPAPAPSTTRTIIYQPAPTETVVEQQPTNTATSTNNANATDTTGVATTDEAFDYSGLAANAIYGVNSFLPSGLIQWVLFTIFVMLLIIFIRRLFGATHNYHSTPLKIP